MSCAYVVLAHKAPRQLARLVARLQPGPVFVHIDAAVPRAAFAAFGEAGAQATFVARHRSGWASWGLVAAALEGLRAAQSVAGWTHVQLLSGEDYPLWPAEWIADLLAGHPDESFIAQWGLPARVWGADGGMARIRYRHMPVRRRRAFLPIPRRMPAGIRPYGGSMYWCLSRAASAEVLRWAQERAEVVRFYRRAWIPDEMFVPTVLMNSPERERVINETLTFIRWPAPESPHPAILRTGDFEALSTASSGPSRQSGYGRVKLYARKFDETVDSHVLDLVDERLLAPSRPRPTVVSS